MDIQEKKAFDQYFKEKYQEFHNEVFDENGDDRAIIGYSFAWSAWQAAKAQSVPDVQQALNDRLLVRSIKEQVESHIAEISVNDLFDKGWFAAMKCIQSNIDMLEAREPAND